MTRNSTRPGCPHHAPASQTFDHPADRHLPEGQRRHLCRACYRLALQGRSHAIPPPKPPRYLPPNPPKGKPGARPRTWPRRRP